MLYFIPTPIGNIEDISKRSLSILKIADVALCEDTRVTKKLIGILQERFDIEINIKKFISLHSHNEKRVLQSLDKYMFDQTVIYMSDAGMPCVSDPGSLLVKYAQENGIKYEVLPGANAAVTSFASSGFEEKEFLFFGFLPHKGSERKKALNEVLNSSYNTILYEAPHRIKKLLEEISLIEPNREVFVQKEISKIHQKWYKNSAKIIKETLNNENSKGEWVVVIKGEKKKHNSISKEDIINANISNKQKAKFLAKITDKSIKEWYDELIGT